MKTLKLNALAVFAFLAIGFTSCNDDDATAPVVVPPDNTITGLAIATPNLSILVKALTRANLASTFQGAGTFTAFAPTNEAFNAFFLTLGPNVTVDNVDLPTLTKILQNHVLPVEIKSADVPASAYVSTLLPYSSTANSPKISMFVQKVGANVFINGGTATTGVKVTTPDVDASNGVIHIVNKVITIPNVVDHAIANTNFSSLVATLTSAGQPDFVSILKGTGPFTVFAPTNLAFTNLTAELTTSGITLTPAIITSVLKYHVVTPANIVASSLTNNQVVATYLGATPQQSFTVQLPTTGPQIKDTNSRISKIVTTDVQCSNGVIHAIDKVLLPGL